MKVALEALRRSLGSETGQVVPLICTPLMSTDPSRMEGGRYRVIDGHRRLRAAQLAGLAALEAKIVSGPRGEPVTAFDEACLWAATGVSVKKPTPLQTLRAITRMREAWEQLPHDGQRQPARLTRRDIAARLGISVGTAQRDLRLAEEPREVVDAILQGDIQLGAVEKLIELIGDPQYRQTLVLEIVQINQRRRAEGQPELSIEEIRTLARGALITTESGLVETIAGAGSAEMAAPSDNPAEREDPQRIEQTALWQTIPPSAGQTTGASRSLAINALYAEDPAPPLMRQAAALLCDFAVVWKDLPDVLDDRALPLPFRELYALLCAPEVRKLVAACAAFMESGGPAMLISPPIAQSAGTHAMA